MICTYDLVLIKEEYRHTRTECEVFRVTYIDPNREVWFVAEQEIQDKIVIKTIYHTPEYQLTKIERQTKIE